MNKGNLILFLISVLLFGACQSSSKEEEINKNEIIPEEKMIVVLADMQLAESYLDFLRKNGNQTKDSAMVYFERVFKKHQINQEEFEKSLLFYKKDLDHMGLIYTNVITRLNELKAKSEEMIQQMKADSLRQDSLRALQIADSINMLNDSIFVNDTLIDTINYNN